MYLPFAVLHEQQQLLSVNCACNRNVFAIPTDHFLERWFGRKESIGTVNFGPFRVFIGRFGVARSVIFLVSCDPRVARKRGNDEHSGGEPRLLPAMGSPNATEFVFDLVGRPLYSGETESFLIVASFAGISGLPKRFFHYRD